MIHKTIRFPTVATKMMAMKRKSQMIRIQILIIRLSDASSEKSYDEELSSEAMYSEVSLEESILEFLKNLESNLGSNMTFT
jgi:hypothetical protein